MSSYRSYRPWNSSLSSYSTPSNYRSRYGADAASTAASSTSSSKFSSITPSSYRPSYSSTSGTYRASRAPPISSTTSTPSTTTSNYTRTYSNLGKSRDEEKEKPKTYTKTYSNLGKDKASEDEKEKIKTYTRSYTTVDRIKTSIATGKEKEKEQLPYKRTLSRYDSAKDLSAETKSRLSSTYGAIRKEEKGPPITFNTRYKVTTARGRSRDPSPNAESVAAPPQTALQRLTAARDRSRDPSPSYKGVSTTRERSRDPSPAYKGLSEAFLKNSSVKSRDPSPVAKSYIEKVGDSSKVSNRSSASLTSREKAEPSYTSHLSAREKSQEFSRRPSITSNYSHSRDPSPVDNKYNFSTYQSLSEREKLRKSSPSISVSRTKLRESSPLSILSYRRSSREPSPAESLNKSPSNSFGFSSLLSNKTYSNTQSITSPPQKNPDISISYMTANEVSARPSRASFINRHSPLKDNVESLSKIPLRNDAPKKLIADNNEKSAEVEDQSSSTEEEETDESSEDEQNKPENKIMIQVTTITRGTSPTAPLENSCPRIRRIEVAKTIEKVRQRPLVGPLMCDKSMQSDDSSRYSSCGVSSRAAYSTYSPTSRSYSRYSANLTSKHNENLSAAENENSESSDRTSQKSDKFNFKLPNSKEASPNKESSCSSSLTKSASPCNLLKQRVEASKSSRLNIKNRESLSPNKIDLSLASSNKDFRKSALNMGPTDRKRNSKSTSDQSSSSPTVEKTRILFQQLLNTEIKISAPDERSPSIDSQSSEESNEIESTIEQKPVEPTKREIINQKVEEAKSFLLKTLGNPSQDISKSEARYGDFASESSMDTNSIYSLSPTSLYAKDSSTKFETISNGETSWNDESQLDDNTIVNDLVIENSLDVSHTPQHIPDTNKSEKWSWLNENGRSLNESLQNLKRVQSGEKPWWCQSPENKNTSDNQAVAQNFENPQNNLWEQETQADISEIQCDDDVRDMERDQSLQILNNGINHSMTSLGDRASPEGVEAGTDQKLIKDEHQRSSYQKYELGNYNAVPQMFISKHTNIDDLLGGSSVFNTSSSDFELVTPDAVKIHNSNSPPKTILNKDNYHAYNYQKDHEPSPLDGVIIQTSKRNNVDKCSEQEERLEGNKLSKSNKNSIIISTQVKDRIYEILEKLLTAKGKDLSRVLFSLKQIFHEDRELVNGFVELGGLNCLIQIGNESDQNFQNFVLRALGQVMLYIDGMNGVMKHSPTVQWLYGLISSKYRLVVKTALKLLLVFVEYCEGNCYLFVNAVKEFDRNRGKPSWENIMKLLKDYSHADTELLIYATSLINKTVAGLNDQESFYDEIDSLEDQGMEVAIKHFRNCGDVDLELLDQFHLYEAVLQFEDAGQLEGTSNILGIRTRKSLRTRSLKSRKSKRCEENVAPPIPPPLPSYQILPPIVPPLPMNYMIQQRQQTADNDSSSSGGDLNGFTDCKVREGAGVTPALRRRRERAEQQKSFQKAHQEQEDSNNNINELENEEKTDDPLLHMKREQTVKDLTRKLSNLPISPQEEKPNRVGDLSGLISKAKEELERSRNKSDIKATVENDVKKAEPNKSEIELHWEELLSQDRDLMLNEGLDFRDLTEEDEVNVFQPKKLNGTPPCPPPSFKPNGHLNLNFQTNSECNGKSNKKTKKTVKLFWKEVREDMIPAAMESTIWDELPSANVDTEKLEHLFESRAKDLLTKKQQDFNKTKELIVLDHKRSNAINIAITKLPPARAIKIAISKMDSTVITREAIEKLMNLLPSLEETNRIQEAQNLNPDLPLGSAEQFLLTLSSISEIAARLKLWSFKLDFENIEKEIAEPLMDLKVGVQVLRTNETFKSILSHLLTIGCFLNGQPVKGFQIEYLAKVPEVKDTVHKHSLLHHLCHMVMESAPHTTDLYSEIGPITRASKADFADLAHNIKFLETECKASWDRLKLISKHDTSPQLKQKLIEFLADCAERIIILDVVHRRVINRYHKFLLWLGVPFSADLRPNEFCRIISEFALEYRTTRERVHQQVGRKPNQNERNISKGKLTTDSCKFSKTVRPDDYKVNKEEKQDAELRQLLGKTVTDGTDTGDINGTLRYRRRRPEKVRSSSITNRGEDNPTDGDDEIIESLVKTATKTPTIRTAQRERKRFRNSDRNAVKRSRTREGFGAQRSPSPL